MCDDCQNTIEGNFDNGDCCPPYAESWDSVCTRCECLQPVSPGTDDCFIEDRLFVVDSFPTTLELCKEECESSSFCTVSYESLYHFKISIGK